MHKNDNDSQDVIFGSALSAQQKMVGFGGLFGFGLGSLVGLFFFGKSFPSSIVGIGLGALIGRYLWHFFVRPKA